MPSPVAFLCHASENKALASRIASSLYQNGIPTFLDAWEIGAGESIVQRLNQGLSSCTHFIVLSTTESVAKPWVNAEMDAAFVLKIEGTSKFIPLRFALLPKELPPLLKALHAPELTEEGYDDEIKALVSDIFEISRRPKLGCRPKLLDPTLDSCETGNALRASLLTSSPAVFHTEQNPQAPADFVILVDDHLIRPLRLRVDVVQHRVRVELQDQTEYRRV